MPAAAVAVSARKLTKRYGDFVAVNQMDLDVAAGACFGFLGPNGAGKTTMMKMIYGRFPPTAGSLTVLGQDVTTAMRGIKARIGVVGQEDNLDPDFSCLDNLVVFASYFGLSATTARPRARALLNWVQLTEKQDVSVSKLSGGMKRRLVIARALINQPELVVLDEPTTGLDPQARHLVWSKLRELRASGVTLLLTTHYMDEASRLCDRLAMIDQGQVLALGTPGELVQRFAGRHVLEIFGLNGQALTTAADIVTPLALAVITTETTLTCCLAEAGVAAVALARLSAAALSTTGHAERPATLEDVFLQLAGHRLREG